MEVQSYNCNFQWTYAYKTKQNKTKRKKYLRKWFGICADCAIFMIAWNETKQNIYL